MIVANLVLQVLAILGVVEALEIFLAVRVNEDVSETSEIPKYVHPATLGHAGLEAGRPFTEKKDLQGFIFA